MLDHITIQGFKGIASNEDLELRLINVLIGANCVGKSNFIGVFHLLRAVGGERLRDYVATDGGAERLLHFGSKVTQRIASSLSVKPGIEKCMSPNERSKWACSVLWMSSQCRTDLVGGGR
jgi:predicted ATPase